MKRIAIVAVSVMVMAALALGVSTAMAAKPSQTGGGKPPEVIQNSNGFPSGFHFNLNIHGKDWEECQVTCSGDCGNSVYIPEYGNATIQYVSNKKRAAGNLTVLDPCAGFGGEEDTAKVLLPYNIETDTYSGPADGYWVYGRILGKPQHGWSGNESSMIIYPNPVLHVCNTTDPLATDCPIPLGLVTSSGVYDYDATNNVFVRFEQPTDDKGQGKGKSDTKDMTPIFEWTGWVGNATLLDLNEDGVLDDADVPGNATDIISIDYGMDPCDYDLDGDCIVDKIEEWLDFQVDIGNAWFYENEWVFNLADIVIQDQDLKNDGTKLLQIRFYPRATTTYH